MLLCLENLLWLDVVLMNIDQLVSRIILDHIEIFQATIQFPVNLHSLNVKVINDLESLERWFIFVLNDPKLLALKFGELIELGCQLLS